MTNIERMFESIDMCHFECEAGSLANNVIYQQLRDKVKLMKTILDDISLSLTMNNRQDAFDKTEVARELFK